MATLELTVDLLHRFLASIRYHYDDAPDVWNIMGLRSAVPVEGSPTIRTVPDQPNLYNDTIVVFGSERTGQLLCRCYRCSVDPGLPYTVHPMNARGCAHLINGQYRYKVGLHKGHTALVQAGNVKVWRDEHRDFIRHGDDPVETGQFAIHIHAGGTTALVGRYSAGCSVIWGGWHGAAWSSFIHRMTTSPSHLFWYSLLDAAQLVGFSREGTSIDAGTAELPEVKRQALQQVLTGIALLYAYEEPAHLGAEGEVTFTQLLNRLRGSGILANLKLADRPPIPPVTTPEAAREALINGFRVIYANLVDSGLDHTFHSQLNQLRSFGPLGGL